MLSSTESLPIIGLLNQSKRQNDDSMLAMHKYDDTIESDIEQSRDYKDEDHYESKILS